MKLIGKKADEEGETANRHRLRHLLFFLTCLIICVLFQFPGSFPAWAQQEEEPAPEQEGEMQNPYRLLDRSLAESLAAELKQQENFQQALAEARDYEQLYRERLDAYRIQLSAHRNMLVLPTIAEYDLEEARGQHLATLDKLTERAEELEGKLEKIRRRLENGREKLDSYKSQKQEIAEGENLNGWADSAKEKLVRLIDILSDQNLVLKETETIYADLLQRAKALQAEYQATAENFEQVISELEEERLLRRSVNPLSQFGMEQIRRDFERLSEKTGRFFSLSYWKNTGLSDNEAYLFFILFYFLLLAALMTVLGFFRSFCSRLRDICENKNRFWQYLAVRLLRRSLFLGAGVLYILLFPIKPAYEFTPLFLTLRLAAELGIVVLMVRWGLNFLHVLWNDAESPFFRFLYSHLTFLLYGIMSFGIFYYLIGAAICETCVLLVLLRIGFEILLIAWSVVFWRRFRRYSRESPLAGYPWFEVVKPLLPAAGYIVVLMGLFFEVIGYGSMATLWYTSLARTAAAFMWIIVLYQVLCEFTARKDEEEDEEPLGREEEKPRHVRRLLIRLGKAFLIAAALLALPLAWGARQAFLADFFSALNYEVKLGDMQISVLDLVIAVLVLVFTHALILVWKALLREKILKQREMEVGLKDSISTITGYIGWLIGIMVVFGVLGVNAASLAVLFGAIGIGIGFGLQNIFNNFLSGLILLFERPIQVGDVVEINGIWGTVTRINVRATQVKTYDNADLIIPNADFISRQVTNWSFKDARVRRTIAVTVAYGSNIELVREILYEIAANNTGVYRRPQPEVLFSDFGESGMIFKLRVWAHINYFLNVETDIRFEINEQFREMGIRIPYPQRDLHIRTKEPEEAED